MSRLSKNVGGENGRDLIIVLSKSPKSLYFVTYSLPIMVKYLSLLFFINSTLYAKCVSVHWLLSVSIILKEIPPMAEEAFRYRVS